MKNYQEKLVLNLLHQNQVAIEQLGKDLERLKERMARDSQDLWKYIHDFNERISAELRELRKG
ncbi:MAG: hypothetical protein ACTSX6_04635 [Candidatus Heimdallarchaeaceae archaeon]